MILVPAHDAEALRRTAKTLLCSASAMSLMWAMPAFAQDDAADDEEVVVDQPSEDQDVVVAKGIRRSLKSA